MGYLLHAQAWAFAGCLGLVNATSREALDVLEEQRGHCGLHLSWKGIAPCSVAGADTTGAMRKRLPYEREDSYCGHLHEPRHGQLSEKFVERLC